MTKVHAFAGGATSAGSPPRAVRRAPFALLLAASCGLVACGHGRDYEGTVVVDNRTDLTTMEDLLDFRLARFGHPYSEDLLGGSLGPASARWLGEFREDFYDATGELSGGETVDWSDEYVGYERTTTFEVR